jgi:Ca2+-binding EF-hand superfamily protein
LYIADNEEFLAASTPLSKIITDSNLESAFRMLDSDGSGKLSAKELKDHLGGQVSQEYYKTILSFFDMDRDGEVLNHLHRFHCMSSRR